MKLTKLTLKQLIQEEIQSLNEEESIESMKSKIASEVEGMEYQDAINHIQRMFRAMQSVMLDVTPGLPDSDEIDMEDSDEMEMEDDKVVTEQDDKSQKKLIDAIKSLSEKFDELDLSIDFLSSVLSGVNLASIGIGQAAKGRYYRPKSMPNPKT